MSVPKSTVAAQSKAAPSGDLTEGEVTQRAIGGPSQARLTDLEARVYVGLLRCGGTRARSLSQLLRTNRVDTYRVLRRLNSRGLVNKTPNEPALYEAVDPEVAARILMGEVDEEVRRMRALVPEIILQTGSLATRTPLHSSASSVSRFKLLRAKSLYLANRDMMARARSEILGVWSPRRTALLGLLDPFIASIRRGVSAQIVCEVDRENMADVDELIDLASVRHHPGVEGALRFTVMDQKELFLGCTPKDTPLNESVSLWSNDPDLVNLFTAQFKLIWAESADCRERVLRLKAAHRLGRAARVQREGSPLGRRLVYVFGATHTSDI